MTQQMKCGRVAEAEAASTSYFAKQLIVY